MANEYGHRQYQEGLDQKNQAKQTQSWLQSKDRKEID